MKSSHSIISKIKSMPQFRRLQEIDEVTKLINALPLDMRKYISFGVQKGKKLCFALNNPLLCVEYNRYKSSIILGIFQEYKEHFKTLQDIQEVWFYFPQKIEQSKGDNAYFNAPKHSAILMEQKEEYYLQKYTEHSQGEFINHATHSKIFEKFEKIRQSILKNLNAR